MMNTMRHRKHDDFVEGYGDVTMDVPMAG